MLFLVGSDSLFEEVTLSRELNEVTWVSAGWGWWGSVPMQEQQV